MELKYIVTIEGVTRVPGEDMDGRTFESQLERAIEDLLDRTQTGDFIEDEDEFVISVEEAG
jgi:hypothetical protein